MEQGGAAGAHDEEGRGDSRFVSSDRRSSRQNVSDPVMIPQLCFKNPGTVNIEKIEDGSLEAPGGTEDDVMSIPVVETVDSQAKMEEAGNSESERETVQIEEMQTHFEDEGTKIPAKFGTGTQTKRHCEKEGHICFDCFPIPDTLLDQLKNQTGLNKLACLQAVQTVVRFYKQDLVCSKYFAYETTDDTYSEYSHGDDNENLDDTAILFRATPTPVRRQQRQHQQRTQAKQEPVEDQVDSRKPRIHKNQRRHTEVEIPIVYRSIAPIEQEYEFDLESPCQNETLRLCTADKFRNMIRRLKLESGSEGWNDPRNVSTVFKFYRKMNKVVASMDKSTLKRVVLEDDFKFMTLITNLLRKETRWSMQWEVIGIIGNIAARNSRTRRALMDSDFPKYLKRVILDPTSDTPKVAAYAELLTVLFSDGKPIPVPILEHFDMEFVVSILRTIEDDMSQPGWAIPDTLVKLLLSYNLQFSSDDVYANSTIMGIALMEPCKTFASRLINWLDFKDASLTSSWEVSKSIHQGVIKMITDIFLCRKTAHIFSVAQAVMLLRELTRSLTNFSAGDNRRTAYLKLIHTTLRHCKYDYVRNTPCVNNLEEILCEDIELSYEDQRVIRSIFKDFPQLQKSRYVHFS